VPLSEDEERILNEIERGFYRHDPRSAKRISGTTLPRYLARNCRWALLGFIGGLIILLVSFASSWILGLVGFGVIWQETTERVAWAVTVGSSSPPTSTGAGLPNATAKRPNVSAAASATTNSRTADRRHLDRRHSDRRHPDRRHLDRRHPGRARPAQVGPR
jgi:hypothetical protein